MSQLEQVRAITWDGTASFPMTGVYGKDATGRWVLTREGRYQIPDDAIVLRAPAPSHAPEEPAPAPEPVTPEPVKSEPVKATKRKR